MSQSSLTTASSCPVAAVASRDGQAQPDGASQALRRRAAAGSLSRSLGCGVYRGAQGVREAMKR